MDPLNLIKSLFKLDGSTQQHEVHTLRTGQIIVGKILKLFPNQTAEIQVGSQRFIAKLEIPLLANQQYFFQVQAEEGKIRLKMLKQNTNEIATKAMTQGMELPDNTLSQFVTQIPIQLGGHQSEVTIQWNGRKKENGKMDPNYCQILFYLNLQMIGDTFVNIHIQNRIMSMLVINGSKDLGSSVAVLVPILKKRLAEMDYHLTSVKFEEPRTENLPVRFPSASSKLHEGVDIRI